MILLSYSVCTQGVAAPEYVRKEKILSPKLSKGQISFLRKIQCLKEYAYPSEESDIVTYLAHEKMVIEFFDPSSQLAYCKITEYGKSYLYDLKISNRRHRIPLIISIFALIVSALSIVLSPFFQAYFTKLYGL